MPLLTRLARAVDPLEAVDLLLRWPGALLRQVALRVDHPFLTGEHQLLTKDGRRAEICYVMQRSNPAGGLLLHIKRFYPPTGYRLPTGGVQIGEPVLDALQRELYEETGLWLGAAPGEVHLQRLLGILTYDLFHRHMGPVEFATYFFLVQMPPGAILQPTDPDEQIAGWEWCDPGELAGVATVLDGVGAQSAAWADWGHFRAAGHRFVAQVLADG